MTAVTVSVSPVAARIGAVVEGVRLGGELDSITVDTVRDALHRHRVIFFRDQHHLDDAGQLAFARLLGDPIGHPTASAEGELIVPIDNDHGVVADRWHTDVTFVPAYPLASILRAVRLPDVGGDTLWADTASAYAELPAPLAALADSLRAVHSNRYDYVASDTAGLSQARKDYRELFESTVYETEHPVVRIHPVSGERTLVLGAFAQRLVGLDAEDSAALLALFGKHVTRPENTVRWRWRAGDVAIWDNRATQHRVITDFDGARRLLHRVTIDGDVPVGVDGRRSRPVGESVA
ncbi:TauD/TfdA dioxygenase family protein [Embleya sp. MST-111070]|uniref:TauD/TfdA dioxygenase family protein n=1 Tax=Embleya sp. MST-111070 TaxID=3398231 RepID=UPI003F73FED1